MNASEWKQTSGLLSPVNLTDSRYQGERGSGDELLKWVQRGLLCCLAGLLVFFFVGVHQEARANAAAATYQR